MDKFKKTLYFFFLIICLSSFISPSYSETLTMDDLVERNDLFYKKFTDIPFTGEVSGDINGSFRKGKKNGNWLSYHENGQLKVKKYYSDGITNGAYESYYDNGQLKEKEYYKDGKREGAWEIYFNNGQLKFKGQFKDGIENGLFELPPYTELLLA